MQDKFILNQPSDINSTSLKKQGIKADIIALLIIAVAITLTSISPLASGGKVNVNEDFFLYAAKHEAVRKAILEYHSFPTRSFWISGGYPTLGDPEDPALNPMTLITIVFGSIMGIKIISFIALLIGGLSSYLLTRYILGYSRWGSLFSGLVFGLSIFVPLRVADGNPNEVYASFLPLCLFLIGLACRGRKLALLILPFVFYIMLSDGKLIALMAFFYLGILCLLDIIPPFNTFGTKNLKRINIKPLKIFLLALLVTFCMGMLRILPVLDLISTKGGLGSIDLYHHPKLYIPGDIFTFTFKQLWQFAISYKDALGIITMGFIPIFLSLIVFVIFPRKAFPWGFNLFLFIWLVLAYNAPVDLFKVLWHIPFFSSIDNPFKYFSFPIVFTFAIVAGQFFGLLEKLKSRWLEHIIATALIILSVWFLYPRVYEIQKDTYTFDIPAQFLVKQNEFYNIQGKEIERIRIEPLNSLTYVNLIRGIGTIDTYTAIIIAENAVPRYFVDAKGTLIPNPCYRGEAHFVDPVNIAKVSFRPNSIIIQVDMQKPDTLIINQNYHKDWYSDNGEIFEKNGLIALNLEKTGRYTITMRNISRSFYTGLIISILSLISLILICWSYKTGRLVKWSQSMVTPVRWLPKVILWFID